MATVLPFHRAVVADPAFIGDGQSFSVHTRWIETEFDNTIEPFGGDPSAAADADPALPRQVLVVEVNGRRVEVSLPGDLAPASPAARKPAPSGRGRSGSKSATPAVSGNAVTAPMQGTVVKVAVADGDTVATGDLIAVIEAMKMENPVAAHRDGVIGSLAVEVGASVGSGAVLAEIT